MATIKSYTDLSQSKKLAEILPLESADMRIGNYVGKSGKVDGTNIHYYTKEESFGAPQIIEAWSLAALLDVLPTNYIDDNDTIKHPNLLKTKDGRYMVIYSASQYTSLCNNPIDACYEMIIRLNELKLL